MGDITDDRDLEDNGQEPYESPPQELLDLLPDPTGLPVKEYLGQMGVFCVQMHNDLHPGEIAKLAPLFCSPKFHVVAGHPEHYMLATSVKEYLSNVKLFRKTNPHYSVKATNLTVDVDEENGRAVLIATMDTRGLLGASDHLIRQSVYMARWSRMQNGRWCAWRLEIVRGPGSPDLLSTTPDE